MRLAHTPARRLARLIGAGLAEALRLTRALARIDTQREIHAARNAGITLLPWASPDYPERIAQLADPPPLLWLRGDLELWERPAVAVVGARRPSGYGATMARTLATDLARAGVAVVSTASDPDPADSAQDPAQDPATEPGTAAAVCAGAVESGGGLLVAVVPGGLARCLPVGRGAALSVSERPIASPRTAEGEAGAARLVAALADGVVAVEGMPHGPDLAAARHALDLGRAVMAVPGRVDTAGGRGILWMLQEGAAPVGAAGDVFSALGWADRAPSDLPRDERLLLTALRREPATADALADDVDLLPDQVAAQLVSLELRGLVERSDGVYSVA